MKSIGKVKVSMVSNLIHYVGAVAKNYHGTREFDKGRFYGAVQTLQDLGKIDTHVGFELMCFCELAAEGNLKSLDECDVFEALKLIIEGMSADEANEKTAGRGNWEMLVEWVG